MLISTSKKILEQRLKGVRPLPEDEILTEIAKESMIYVATRTTPRVLTRDVEIDGEDYQTLRILEDNAFIIIPDTPIYDKRNPDYSDGKHLNMDEDLSYSVIYYMAYIITQGAEGDRIGAYRDRWMKQVNDIIGLFDSNYSRAGRETYGLM